MKEITPCGRFWLLKEETFTSLGFTSEYLTQLGPIWNFIPKINNTKTKINVGTILAHIESSKLLGPIRSPVVGTLAAWSTTALLRPEELTTEDYILRIKE